MARTAAELALIIKANADQFATNLKKAEKQFSAFGDRMQSIGQSMSTYVTLPLAAVGAGALMAAAKMDSLQRGLTAVAGSSEAAEQQLARLKEVAKLPGLGLEEAVQGSINLQAAGFSAEQAEATLRAFGNALATVGRGKADLDGVILALGQIQSKGKVSAEEINQIAERVPQIRQVMVDAFGTAVPEAIGKMGISSTEFVNRVTAELGKLPQVTGGLQNAFENFSDSIKISAATIGESLNRSFNIEGLLNSLAEKVAALSEWFSNLSPAVQRVVAVAGALAAALGPLLTGFGFITSRIIPLLVSGVGSVSAAFTAMTGPIGLVALAVGAAVSLIVKHWDEIKAYFTSGPGASTWNELKELISSVMEAIGKIVGTALRLVQAIWESFGDEIIAVVSTALGFVFQIIGRVLDSINDVISIFKEVAAGNWEGVWALMKNAAAKSANFIIDLVFGFVESIAQGFNQLAKVVGFDGFDNVIAGLNEFKNAIKFNVIPEVNNSKRSITEMVDSGVNDLGRLTSAARTTAQSVGDVAPRSMPAENVGPIAPRTEVAPLAISTGGLEQSTQLLSNFGVTTDQVSEKFQTLSSNIQQGTEAIANSIASNMADATQGVQDGQAAFFNAVRDTIKALLAQSIAAFAATWIKSAAATGNPFLVGVAATAPMVVGALFDAMIPKFAKGGMVTGPTLAMLGDNNSGKEVVVPFERMGSFLNQFRPQGGDVVVMDVRLSGSDLLLTQRRQSIIDKRTA